MTAGNYFELHLLNYQSKLRSKQPSEHKENHSLISSTFHPLSPYSRSQKVQPLYCLELNLHAPPLPHPRRLCPAWMKLFFFYHTAPSPTPQSANVAIRTGDGLS